MARADEEYLEILAEYITLPPSPPPQVAAPPPPPPQVAAAPPPSAPHVVDDDIVFLGIVRARQNLPAPNPADVPGPSGLQPAVRGQKRRAEEALPQSEVKKSRAKDPLPDPESFESVRPRDEDVDYIRKLSAEDLHADLIDLPEPQRQKKLEGIVERLRLAMIFSVFGPGDVHGFLTGRFAKYRGMRATGEQIRRFAEAPLTIVQMPGCRCEKAESCKCWYADCAKYRYFEWLQLRFNLELHKSMSELIASILHEHTHGFMYMNNLYQGVMPKDLFRWYPASEAKTHGIPFLRWIALCHSNFRPLVISDLMHDDRAMGLRP